MKADFIVLLGAILLHMLSSALSVAFVIGYFWTARIDFMAQAILWFFMGIGAMILRALLDRPERL